MKEEIIQKREGIISSTEVLTRLKILLGVRSAKELAHIFNLKPNTISSWKKRNTLCYAKVIEICNKHEIDLNELFYAAYQNIAINKSYAQVPIIYLDDYLEYYLKSHVKHKKMKQIYLPKNVSFDIVIQMYINSTERMQAELMYVFCKMVDVANLVVGEDYILLVKNKGFQKYSVIAYDVEGQRLQLCRDMNEKMWLNTKEVSECFQCMNSMPC
ncbi:helix-turn-helix domain-containing protein [Myroides odoratus]|uniref:helix-turn-helix domain-containing protein n=1 Tax=Myroides odoratus TaxID=256 RepID=UPI0007661017|nr:MULTISPECIES: helix-turn-helix domain-containing protein [Myroides]WHT39885.1 helix-turn-helix domain-containing protein [Myroides sp. mNGS23_01]